MKGDSVLPPIVADLTRRMERLEGNAAVSSLGVSFLTP